MKKYDDEFKQNAVKKILDGQSVASVAGELGVGEGLLHKWKRARLATALDAECVVIELRKKLREVEMERDILKRRRLSSAEKARTLPFWDKFKKLSILQMFGFCGSQF
ncbi:MAG: transposase [Acidobacteria bacterium]|jgi:transposase-like protein|nr:transposase [Acidobacteriota bacterium]